MNHYNKLKDLVENMSADVESFFDKGNKAAGTRVRKLLQEVKSVAQELRTDIQEKKNESA